LKFASGEKGERRESKEMETGQCFKCRISGKCRMSLSDFGFRRYFRAI